MKKIAILIAVLVLACAGIYLYVPRPDSEISPQFFISRDAQIVLTQYNLEERVEEFRRSPLGIAVDSLEYELIGKELNLSDEDIARVIEFKQNVSDLFDNQFFKSLVGAEVTIALFPFIYNDERRLEDQLLENLLVVSRPRHGTTLIDVVRWFDFSTQTMSTSRYGRHKISRYDVEDGRRISGVRMNDLLVMSFSEAVLRKSLDVYDNRENALSGVESYNRHIGRFSGASLIVYADFQKLYAQIDQSIQALDGNTEISFDNNAVAAYRMGLFGAWREGDRIVDQAVITFSDDLLDDHTGTRLTIPATEPSTHEQVHKDTILYHWTNQFDFAALVKTVSDSEPAGSGGDSPLNHLMSVTGLSYEQLSGLFTGDLTVAVKDLQDKRLVPLPLFLISAESSDIALLKSSTDKMIDAYSIPVRRKQIGERGELISWGGVIGIGSVLPAFAFNEDLLIISSNRDEITKFIDPGRSESLANSEAFQSVSDEVLKPANSITYIEFSELTGMIEEMANWGGTMIALKDRELARKTKILIEELINPLLDGLAMYRTIASRKYIEDNTIIFESQTILDNGKQQPRKTD